MKLKRKNVFCLKLGLKFARGLTLSWNKAKHEAEKKKHIFLKLDPEHTRDFTLFRLITAKHEVRKKKHVFLKLGSTRGLTLSWNKAKHEAEKKKHIFLKLDPEHARDFTLLRFNP
jgi:cephalosporin hydroxylase